MIKQLNKKMKVAIYLRVSTDEQAKEGHYGLPVQEEKIKSYCQLHDYSVDKDHIYIDDGVSGSLPAEQRPALKKLLEAVKEKRINLLVVYKIDRLARNLRILLNMVHDLENHNTSFCSITEAFETSTPQGKSYLNMLGSFAQLERDTIRERTSNGRTSAVKDGKWVMGSPPFGYVKNKKTKKLKINKKEAEIVKTFFKFLVNEQLSLTEIQRRANDLSFNAPKHRAYKKTTLNYWHKRTIGRILTNEVYTGITYYRKYKRPFNNLTSVINSNLQNSEESWIKMNVPSIISTDLYKSAINQLQKNREFARRNQKRDYLFSKIIYCGCCGFKMFGGYQPSKVKDNEGTKYYHGTYRKTETPGKTERCPKCKQYSESRLEPVWDNLKEIIKNPKNIFSPLKEYNDRQIDKDSINEKIEEIKKQKRSIKIKRNKLIKLYLEDDALREDEYKKYLRKYETKEEKFENEILKLNQLLLSKQEKLSMEQSMQTMYKQIKDRLDNVSYEEKNKIIRLFVDKVILFAKKDIAEVVLKVPVENLELSNNKSDILQDSFSTKTFPVFLKINLISKLERQRQIIRSNPKMYNKKQYLQPERL